MRIAGAALAAFCFATSAQADESKRYGVYIGTAPLLSMNGAAYDATRVQFVYDKDGIHVTRAFGYGGTSLQFTVRYDNSWITRIKNWGIDDCPAVRQHKTSTLAQFVLCFHEAKDVATKGDVVMILGEGIPAVLGVYVRREKGDALLRSIHNEHFRPNTAKKFELDEHVHPVDLGSLRKKVEDGRLREHDQDMRSLEAGLWSASNARIDERLQIVKLAVASEDRVTRVGGLKTFCAGARVKQGIPIVSEVLYRISVGEEKDPDVQREAVSATACLLYEVTSTLKQQYELKQRYGTLSLDGIYLRTDGIIDPETAKLLDDVLRERYPAQAWSDDHHRSLTRSLTKALEYAQLSREARSEAQRALREYALN